MKAIQQVVIVTKPKTEEKRLIGSILSCMEKNGFVLRNVYRVNLKDTEVYDLHALMGKSFDDDADWDVGGGDSFVFTFDREDAHKIIDDLGIQKVFPVVYIKKLL